MKRPLILLTTLVCLLLSAIGIVGQDDDVINIDSSIVRLNVGVVDGRGKPITNLSADDFSVYEDGVKQKISKFETSSAPFSLVLLLDMSGSTTSFREVIKMSALRFVTALAPDDRVAVIEFYDKVNLRTDFTSDRNKIAFSINAANGQGKTHLYKALDLALDKLSREGRRRKAIIVLTDGIDTIARDQDRNRLLETPEDMVAEALKPESNESLNRVLNRADKQGVTVFPLALPSGDPAKLADPTPRQVAMYKVSRARLDLLANRTGGTLNTINRLEEMGKFYAAVAAELRTLFTVEYQPANDKRDGKWRDIRIEVKDPDLIAKTRKGYFAK
jgi:VWFA-related protein